MKTFVYFLILLALSYWSVRPLFVAGFFPMHDDTQPARVYEMYRALSAGQFPVRWVPDLGYGSGYPIFNFYAPLAYYVGAAPLFIGVDALTATKLMIGVGVVLAPITMFFLGTALAGPVAGLVSAMVYLYAPYHAVNIYVRGAVAELYGYALLPLVLLGIYRIVMGKQRHGMIIGSIGVAGVLLSHNILGMLTLFFLISGLLIVGLLGIHSWKRHQSRYIAIGMSILLGIGLSAFFTLPALLEKDYTKISGLVEGGSDFHSHFVTLSQVWDSPWGYAGSAPGEADGMSFKIGKIHILIEAITIFVLAWWYRRKKISGSQALFVGLSGIVFISSIFFMLSLSEYVWELIPGFSYIQYPWRFLNITLLCVAVSSAMIFLLFRGYGQIVGAVLIVGTVLWFNTKYFVPQLYDSRTVEDYTSSPKLYYSLSAISDEYLPRDYQPPSSLQEIVPAGIPVQPLVTQQERIAETSTNMVWHLDVSQEGWIETTFSYFPGWHASVDDIPARVRQEKGLLQVYVPKGEHTLQMVIRSTPVEYAANGVSLLSLFLLGYVCLFRGDVVSFPKMKMPWGRSHRSMW